jgi:hypothetical protein
MHKGSNFQKISQGQSPAKGSPNLFQTNLMPTNTVNDHTNNYWNVCLLEIFQHTYVGCDTACRLVCM